MFLHWRIAPEVLQAQLPDEVTVETFDGSAWLGLVPFWYAVRLNWQLKGLRPSPLKGVQTQVATLDAV